MMHGVIGMGSIERIPTGVPGLDEMIDGGLPMPSLILLAGDVGSGKTTLCSQFLCKGAKLGEIGLYFMTCGGPPEWIINFISTYEFVDRRYFGENIKYFDLQKAIEDAHPDDILCLIQSDLESFQPTRVVIDSISVIEEALKGDFRRFLTRLSCMIKEHNAVAIVTGDAMPGVPYSQEIAQIADGVILLQNAEINMVRRRSIEILKMSGTAHRLGKHVVDISAKGLMVYPGL